MAPRKTERLLNLTILLLSSRRPICRDQIWRTIEGYRGLDEVNFEATFERDKKELRAMGVSIETGPLDVLFDDEIGYQIHRSDFELPPIEFASGELVALGLAAGVWRLALTGEQTNSALTKLRASGIATQPVDLPEMALRLSARESAFDVVFSALNERRAVRFSYRDPSSLRRVQPWRLAWRKNSWYLLGFDLDRQAPRVFKLSRMTSDPVPFGAAGAYRIPDGERLGDYMAALAGPSEQVDLLVGIRTGRAPGLRRQGQRLPDDPRLPADYQTWQVVVAAEQVVEEIGQYGADVLVLEPDETRREIVHHCGFGGAR